MLLPVVSAYRTVPLVSRHTDCVFCQILHVLSAEARADAVPALSDIVPPIAAGIVRQPKLSPLWAERASFWKVADPTQPRDVKIATAAMIGGAGERNHRHVPLAFRERWLWCVYRHPASFCGATGVPGVRKPARRRATVP